MQAPQVVPQRRPSRAARAITETCCYLGLDEGVLRAHTRTCGCHGKKQCRCGCSPRGPEYTQGRRLICYLLSRDLAVGHMHLGLLLARDHSTVTHYVRGMEALLPTRSDLRWHLEQVRAILREKGILYGHDQAGSQGGAGVRPLRDV